MAGIPVLNGSDLWENPGKFAADFHAAYSTFGFAYLENHRVAQSLIDAVFAANVAFHELPQAQKQAIELDSNHRGFIRINSSIDVNSAHETITKPNQSESFMAMREEAIDPARYLSGPNRWPELPGFRDTLQSYMMEMEALADRLFAVAMTSLGAEVPLDFAPATLWLRLLYYPKRAADAPGDLYGSAPHNDFGCLTLLAQDDAGGLQVKARGGGWIDVPPREGAFVVNVGDMLHRYSNGILRSTPHRVINRSGRARYSVPFFYDPSTAARVAPLPGTGAPRFQPQHFGDFLRRELGDAYAQHQGAEGLDL